MPTFPTNAELLDTARRHARKVLIGGKAELMPIIHLVKANGEQAVVGAPWQNDDEKQIILAALTAMMRDGDVIRYSMVSEAWAVDAERDAALPTRVRDMPNRREMVLAVAVDHAGRTVRVWELKRDLHGACVDLIEEAPFDDVAGAFLELLPRDA